MSVSDFHWEPAGFIEILNGPGTRLALQLKAEEGVGVAQEVYAIQSKHQEKGPIFYDASFFTRMREQDGLPVVEFGNHDPEWIFIEFGLWAAGSGGNHIVRKYKYRVLGHTLDILAAGGHL